MTSDERCSILVNSKILNWGKRLPAILFFVLLAITAIAWQYASKTVKNAMKERARKEAQATVSALDYNFGMAIGILNGLQGLFAASHTIERDEFNEYVNITAPFIRFPGLVGLRYIQRVPNEEREAFIKSMKFDTSLESSGYPAFQIHPQGLREEYYVMKYRQPYSANDKSLGFDVLTDSARREMLEKARDTGKPTATNRIVLLQDEGKDETGLIIALPIYRNKSSQATVEERRAALLGFVTAAFRIRDLFSGIVAQNHTPHLHLQIFDRSNVFKENMLFDSHPVNAPLSLSEEVLVESGLNVANRRWKLCFYFPKQVSLKGVDAFLPMAVLLTGLLLSFLITGLLGLQIYFRRRAESMAAKITDELRSSEEHLRLVANISNDVLWELDFLSSKVKWGKGLEKVLGYSPDTPTDMAWLTERVHPEDRQRIEKSLEDTLKYGDTFWSAEFRLKKADGAYIHIYDRAYLVYPELGKPSKMIGAIMDITQRKQGEEMLKRTNEELVKRERALLNVLSDLKKSHEHGRKVQEQLFQSQKMEAIGQLAGGIAHDFNNLLTVINGYAELAIRKLDKNHSLHVIVEEIQKAGTRAAALTQQLLAFSRRQIIQPKVLNLNDLILEMNKMNTRLLMESVEMETFPGQDLWPIKADPGQLQQTVMNLVVNASDAMQNKGKLTIETKNVVLDAIYAEKHPGVSPGEYVLLAISDTGCGMSQEVQKRIFEPFFTTKGPEKGTGLGLATVFGIVKQSGGTIEVYSELGKGTTFKLYFPRLRLAGNANPTRPVEENIPLPRGNETILLVEDEESVRSLALRVLETQGYRVLEASNGEEALQVLGENPEIKIHLLFSDAIMPKMDGSVLIERLRAVYPELKCLLTSGHTDNAVSRQNIFESNIQFLQKPYSIRDLARKVREVLDG